MLQEQSSDRAAARLMELLGHVRIYIGTVLPGRNKGKTLMGSTNDESGSVSINAAGDK